MPNIISILRADQSVGATLTKVSQPEKSDPIDSMAISFYHQIQMVMLVV